MMVTFGNEEDLVHTETHTKLFFGERDRGDGTLYISENCLAWRGIDEDDTLTLQYPSIALHAISRDTTTFPHECLYCLLESPDAVTEDERDPEADVTEIRFVPEDSNHIKCMYDAVTLCQELHPDAADDDSDDDDDLGGMVQHGQFFTAENMPDNIELSEEGQAVLQRLQQSMQMNVIGDADELVNEGDTNGHVYTNWHGKIYDQFDDADEEFE